MNNHAYLQNKNYKYFDEINEAILRQFPLNRSNNCMALDVGCGTGVLSEAIKNKGYAVWGIELNEEAAQIARERITRVINADLTDIASVKQKIGDKLFDYIIFSDILEHIYDPLTALKEYSVFLKDEGLVLVSLPNTVAWFNRILFLFGRFEYTDTGIMDCGHIRFFTLKTAKRMVKEAGYTILKVDYMPYIVRVIEPIAKKILLKGRKAKDTDRRLLMDSPYYRWYMKYIYPVEYVLGYFFKSLFAFKMVIVARKQ